MKKRLLAVALVSAMAFAFGGCNSKNENGDHKAEYELPSSEAGSDGQAEYEQEDVYNVYEMAKEIHTAMAVYLTKLSIANESIPNNFDFNEMKYVFKDEGFLQDITCDLSEIDVNGEINYDMYSIHSVTVTYNGITQTYPKK